MDSYVVRIYRRDETNPRNLAGQVEFTDREQTKSFAGIDELIHILMEAKHRKAPEKKRGQTG